jgi:hypothetical protein
MIAMPIAIGSLIGRHHPALNIHRAAAWNFHSQPMGPFYRYKKGSDNTYFKIFLSGCERSRSLPFEIQSAAIVFVSTGHTAHAEAGRAVSCRTGTPRVSARSPILPAEIC